MDDHEIDNVLSQAREHQPRPRFEDELLLHMLDELHAPEDLSAPPVDDPSVIAIAFDPVLPDPVTRVRRRWVAVAAAAILVVVAAGTLRGPGTADTDIEPATPTTVDPSARLGDALETLCRNELSAMLEVVPGNRIETTFGGNEVADAADAMEIALAAFEAALEAFDAAPASDLADIRSTFDTQMTQWTGSSGAAPRDALPAIARRIINEAQELASDQAPTCAQLTFTNEDNP